MEDTGPMLTLGNAAKYRLDAAIGQGKAGPQITVTREELNTGDQPEHSITVSNTDIDIDQEEVVFYKQHGKWTILFGRAKAHAQLEKHQKVTGRILSSPALKKAKLVEEAEVPDVPATPPQYNEGFANRPRFQDRKPNDRPYEKRSYGPR